MDESTGARGESPFSDAVAAWSRAVGHLSNSVVEANRATLAAFGGDLTNGEREHRDLEPGGDDVAYAERDWEFERSVDRREELGVGEYVRFSKRLTDADVADFARITGDTNRLHLDEAYAERTRFGGRIAHGTLVSGLISAALARLPGLTIYLSQEVEFRAPVDVGARLTAVCEIAEDLGDDRYRLNTRVEDEDGEHVVDGEAIVLVDERPDGDDSGPP